MITKLAIRVFHCCLLIALIGMSLPGSCANARPGDVGDLVINEVDYDQPSTDTAEFIEIRNTSSASVNLDDVTIELINGATGGAVVYDAINLPNFDLPAGDYYVICGDAANVPNCDLDDGPDTNFIQNGSPDAIGLRQTGVLIDAVSYEGNTPGYTETSGSGLEDSAVGAKGISRCPNGSDTNINNVDFQYQDITPGAANNCPSGPVFGACGDPATSIDVIQGSGTSSPKTGEQHILEAVVVGDFQDTTTGLSGFFLQEDAADEDADETTSEGIFVKDNGFGVDVAFQHRVRVLGEVAESYGLTSLINVTNVLDCGTVSLPAYPTVTLPVTDLVEWERHEGMLMAISQSLYVSGHYDYGRYGEIDLSANGRLYNPTSLVEPGAAAQALQDLNDRSRIQLDDGSNAQNPAPYPPYLGEADTLRLGDTITQVFGVLSYAFSAYELHPIEIAPGTPITFTRANPRPVITPQAEPPNRVRVASFNLLNYFTTIDTGAFICGPSGNLECRGADSVEEFTRQREKIISATLAIDADVLGIIEIENNATTAIQDLVDGMNNLAGAVTYAFIDTGVIGTDAIKVALIYKPAVVTPAGAFAILDSTVDPTFLDTKNRPALAQTFEGYFGQRFTVVVNHLKSKGSACNDVGDPDTGDGQGNCNLTRTAAATAIANWLAADPTSSDDADFLIIGDLNAYAMEDPIDALKAASYTDLINTHQGAYACSYNFEAQSGYLDHAMASPSLAEQVVDAFFLPINADEPRSLDYNDYNQPLFYNTSMFKSADHDPLILEIDLGPTLFLPSIFYTP